LSFPVSYLINNSATIFMKFILKVCLNTCSIIQ
jgi:hypothetical protein